ncbi:hypothetical protein L6452_37673 [Arctium lappa]|uniref:Uncharacterized protein n=1 Tax=Arctium lappa TaxID=4217 RepID=A0ACB8Y445_ARCLA|nr:hypothetical protein L6452_37673 [Arctium lappa]
MQKLQPKHNEPTNQNKAAKHERDPHIGSHTAEGQLSLRGANGRNRPTAQPHYGLHFSPRLNSPDHYATHTNQDLAAYCGVVGSTSHILQFNESSLHCFFNTLTHKKEDRMEEMTSLWSYQESVDELKLKIHYTSQELEAVKARANEEMNRNNESVKQLLHLLKLVCNERDEARDQIQNLSIKIMPSMHNTMMISDCVAIDQFHQLQQSPLMKPTKPNSSIAESNSFSDAYNHSSSPVDSLFDPVTSPEFSNINNNTSFMLSNGFHASGSIPIIDHATLMMESMIKGKALPQKGNLLQAVIEAGPLMETLLAAIPDPNWPNLSSPLRSFHIPLVSGANDAQNHMTMMISKQSQPFVEMSCGNFSGGSNILSFDDVFSESRGKMVTGCPRSCGFGQVEKRQRFQ